MARSASDLLAIKNELNNNPLGLSGYLPLANSANDEANATAMNLVRTETPIDKESIPLSELTKWVDADEFIALSQPQRDYMIFVTNGGSINPKAGTELREAVLQFFGLGSETRASIQANLTTPSSRVEMLFKAGTLQVGGTVTPSDIAQARAV